LMLYSYYLINFSYLQSVSPPNSFQYKIL